MRKRDSEAIFAALLYGIYALALGIVMAIKWAVPIVARRGRIVVRQGWENAPAAKRGLGVFAGWIAAPFRWLFSVRNDFAGDGSSSSTPLGFTAKLVTIACMLAGTTIYAFGGFSSARPSPPRALVVKLINAESPAPPGDPPPSPTPSPAAVVAVYPVVRVVDGDTVVVKVDGADVKVRLIGVDTPETVHPSKPVERFGKEASAFTRDLLTGRSVALEYEPGSKLDKYGRTLAYLRDADGLDVNREIIARGFGHAYVKYPFGRMEDYRAAEREAREKGLGLWAPDTAGEIPAPDPPIAAEVADAPASEAPKQAIVYVTNTGTKYHSAGCRYLAKSSIETPLAQAAASYEPCSRCSPPVAPANRDGATSGPARTVAETPTASPPPAGSAGTTATGLPLHVGPRGGVYHYSKSGKKVYQKKR